MEQKLQIVAETKLLKFGLHVLFESYTIVAQPAFNGHLQRLYIINASATMTRINNIVFVRKLLALLFIQIKTSVMGFSLFLIFFHGFLHFYIFLCFRTSEKGNSIKNDTKILMQWSNVHMCLYLFRLHIFISYTFIL